MCKEKWSEFYVENQDRLHYVGPSAKPKCGHSCSKIIESFKDGNSRAFNQVGVLLSMGTCSTAQVTDARS